jgi:hypothetical protein
MPLGSLCFSGCCTPLGICSCTVDGLGFSGNGCNVTLPDPCFEYVPGGGCPGTEVRVCPCATSNGATYFMPAAGAGSCTSVGSSAGGHTADCNNWGGTTLIFPENATHCHIRFILFSTYVWKLLVPRLSLTTGVYLLPFFDGGSIITSCCRPVSGVGDVEIEIL